MLGSLEFIVELAVFTLHDDRFTAERPNARSVFQERRSEAVSACAPSPG
jgi:hypothetical protein